MKSKLLLIVSCVLMLIISGCAWQEKNIKSKGMFHEFHGIYTMVEPTDLKLYRALLPAPLEMPDQPVISIFVVDYIDVSPWPMTRYQEGALFLRSKYKGQEGWYCKTMPVTKWFPNQGGRALGFPKYVADSITLTPESSGWKGEVKDNGQRKLSLEFSSGLTRTLTPKEEMAMKAGLGKTLAEPVFLFVPPDKGPALQKVDIVNVFPPSWTTEPGMVRITIGAEEPWAGLVVSGVVSPGIFAKFRGATYLKPTKLNSGTKDQP